MMSYDLLQCHVTMCHASPVQEIAEETWMKYLLRNQSVVVREFQGQLKSTLVCPHCNGLSKIFDPFMFLSLPLPIKKTRTIYVSVVKAEPGQPIVKVGREGEREEKGEERMEVGGGGGGVGERMR